MTFKIDEFHQYLEIDKYKLDEVVIRQPSLFYEVSEELASANAERDALKEQIATTDAKLDIEIRKYHAKIGIKITDTSVKALIQADPDHEAAFKAYLTAKEYADKIGALKDAFHARGYMLRDLCSLYVANYFEEGSLRATNRTDLVHYNVQRDALSNERQKRERTRLK